MRIAIITFIFLTLSFIFVGCFDSLTEDDKSKLKNLSADNLVLGLEILEVKKKIEAGTLTQEEGTKILVKLKKKLAYNQEVISDIKDSGGSGIEIAGYWVFTLVADIVMRGLPSKGAGSILRRIFGMSVRKET